MQVCLGATVLSDTSDRSISAVCCSLQAHLFSQCHMGPTSSSMMTDANDGLACMSAAASIGNVWCLQSVMEAWAWAGPVSRD